MSKLSEAQKSRMRWNAANRRRQFELEGHCTACGGIREDEHKRCATCREYHRARHIPGERTEYERKNKASLRARWRAAGLCGHCGHQRVPGRKLCATCANPRLRATIGAIPVEEKENEQ